MGRCSGEMDAGKGLEVNEEKWKAGKAGKAQRQSAEHETNNFI